MSNKIIYYTTGKNCGKSEVLRLKIGGKAYKLFVKAVERMKQDRGKRIYYGLR